MQWDTIDEETRYKGVSMKIKFRQSGGFAGMVKSIEVERKDLSDEEFGALKSMVDQAKFFDLPEPAPHTQHTMPDMEQYSISIESGGQTREMHLTKSTVPKELKPLIKYMAGKAKYEKR